MPVNFRDEASVFVVDLAHLVHLAAPSATISKRIRFWGSLVRHDLESIGVNFMHDSGAIKYPAKMFIADPLAYNTVRFCHA